MTSLITFAFHFPRELELFLDYSYLAHVEQEGPLLTEPGPLPFNRTF